MAEEAKKEEGSQESAPKKKPSLMMLVLFGQVLLLVGASGLIVKSLMMSKKPDLRQATLKESAIQSIRDEEAKIQIMDMEEFVVNISKSYILRTKIQIEVSDEQVVEKLMARKPAIRARILGLLSTQEAKASGKIQAKLLLKDAIREAINEELYEKAVADRGHEIRSPAAAHSKASSLGVVREVYLVDFVLSRG